MTAEHVQIHRAMLAVSGDLLDWQLLQGWIVRRELSAPWQQIGGRRESPTP